MLPDYEDIRSRIDEEPTFFDKRGVPRYGEFHPNMLGVYDDHALLIRIGCQNCFKTFLVSTSWHKYHYIYRQQDVPPIETVIERYHYGDPPRHGCVGDTMNCFDLEVVQAWEQAPLTTNKGQGLKLTDRWQRLPEHEGPMEDYYDWPPHD